jgi:hypothetical protein
VPVKKGNFGEVIFARCFYSKWFGFLRLQFFRKKIEVGDTSNVAIFVDTSCCNFKVSNFVNVVILYDTFHIKTIVVNTGVPENNNIKGFVFVFIVFKVYLVLVGVVRKTASDY